MATLSMASSALDGHSVYPADSVSQSGDSAVSGLSLEETVNMLVNHFVKAAYLAGAHAGVNAGLVAGLNTAFDFMSTQGNQSMLSQAPTGISSVGPGSAASTAPVSIATSGSIAMPEEKPAFSHEQRQRERVEGVMPDDNSVVLGQEAMEELADDLEREPRAEAYQAIPKMSDVLDQRTII